MRARIPKRFKGVKEININCMKASENGSKHKRKHLFYNFFIQNLGCIFVYTLRLMNCSRYEKQIKHGDVCRQLRLSEYRVLHTVL